MASFPPQQVCRICLSDDELQVSIYGAYARKHKIPIKIKVCLPISVDRTDELPKTICYNCVYRLDQYYDYYCNSLTTQRILNGGKFSHKDYFKKKVAQKMSAAVKRQERGTVQERAIQVDTVVPIQEPPVPKNEVEDLLSQSPQMKQFFNNTYVVAKSPAPIPSSSFLDLKNGHRKKRNGTTKMLALTYDVNGAPLSPSLFGDEN